MKMSSGVWRLLDISSGLSDFRTSACRQGREPGAIGWWALNLNLQACTHGQSRYARAGRDLRTLQAAWWCTGLRGSKCQPHPRTWMVGASPAAPLGPSLCTSLALAGRSEVSSLSAAVGGRWLRSRPVGVPAPAGAACTMRECSRGV